ncbi:efflux RND transporter periplasmic adaptor subunit [Bacillus sp. Cs-700]|uniref:efflux RND transporter periplasmic adaptor subunit n=1 Tax=Bacillus sp. Cs-700 TaxID=2589818 RepID=UPI001408D45F|nr:efflux RND transporter periplasmic adaptor subunit [Bacillus sp. Cs-700]
MKKKIILGSVTVGILSLVLINLFIFQGDQETTVKAEEETYIVEEKRLTDVINVGGEVKPKNQETYYIDSSIGTLKEILVDDGEEIEIGSPLYSYENPKLLDQLERAKLSKSRALIQLEQLNSQEDKLNEESNDYEGEFTPNAIGVDEESIKFDRRLANLDYKEAELEISSLHKEINELTIHSEMKGIVKIVGNDLSLGSPNSTVPLVTVVSEGEYLVYGKLPEYDSPLVTPGMKVKIKAKAVPDKVYEGEIVSVSSLPDNLSEGEDSSGNKESMYTYKAKFKTSPKEMKSGYSVNIEVQIDRKDKQPIIPIESIETDEKGEYIFLKKSEENIEKTYIEAGVINGGYREVLNGLKVGDEILASVESDLESDKSK